MSSVCLSVCKEILPRNPTPEDKEGSGGVTTKAEPAARRRRQNRRPDDEGRTGGPTTKAEPAARR